LRRPRQWGACWLAMHLWSVLDLDGFWSSRLRAGRKGTRWLSVLKALVGFRLIDPGTEFRFHRERFVRSAMGDLLGEDFALAQKDKPYRCLDLLLKHRDDLFDFLKERWDRFRFVVQVPPRCRGKGPSPFPLPQEREKKADLSGKGGV